MRGLVLVLLLVAPARADVTLEQPAGVCSVEAMRDQLATLPHPEVDATARISTTLRDRDVAATVTIGAETRSVTARDCRELARSVALILAMWLREAPVAQPAPVEPTLVEPAPEPAPIAVERPARDAGSDVHFRVVVGGAGDVRGMPSLFAGGRVGLRRWSLGLELETEPSRTIEVEAGGRVLQSRSYLVLAPCANVGPLGFCALATAGYLRGQGMELADAVSVRRPFLQAGARVEWTRPLIGRIAVRVHADATQALTESRFMVDQVPVWTSDPYELRLGLGVVAHIP